MSEEPAFTDLHEKEIADLIEEGRTTEAWDRLLGYGDPETWTSRVGRTIAARLFQIRGASRKSDLFHLRGYRDHPDDPGAAYYASFRIEARRGQLPALRMIRRVLATSEDPRSDPAFSSLYLALSGIYADFRDFDRAWEAQEIAEALEPEDCWIRVRRSHLLLEEDRTEESLEVAESALAMRPHYRAALATVANGYWSDSRDEEAIDLLRSALEHNASGMIAGHLTRFYDEIGEYEAGLEMVDEYERRSPMAEEALQKYFAGMRANFHFLLGDSEKVVTYAESADSGFYKTISERIESGEFAKGNRKVLPVGFVRQNEMTCAPATLTALAKFWGQEADHLSIAEEICYDGTPGYKERLWAQEEGWYVREFTADSEVTEALIDAGIPFALATVEPTSAHLQAVIGFDSRAGTLIIRDPGDRSYRESLSKEFFEQYAFSGPRAMAFVPKGKSELLDAIELPDANLFDHYFTLQGALEHHQREAAEKCVEKMNELVPEHRLAEMAAISLHSYDKDHPKILPILERLSAAYPDSKKYRLDIFWRIQEFQTRAERIEWLSKELEGDEVLTVFYKELADLLADDSQSLEEALYYYRRALYFRRLDAETLRGYAGVLWEERELEEATELYRFASSREIRNETHADNYFRACRCIGKPEEGIAWLRNRYEKLGAKASGPIMTLFGALKTVDDHGDRFALLDEALQTLPDDGELLLFAAGEYGNAFRFEEAEATLEKAEGKCSRASLLRSRARLASLQMDPKSALAAWNEILELEPFAMDGYRAAARFLAESEGNEAAVERLEKESQRYPNFVPLRELHISWLRDLVPGRAEGALKDLLEGHPSDAWAMRELAIDLQESGKLEEARTTAEAAVALRPNQTHGHGILGSVLEDLGEKAASREAYREALRLDIDNGFAIRCLVHLAETDEEKRAELERIENELTQQVTFGEGLAAFRRYAFQIMAPEELAASLERAREARPDLWQAWSVLIEQKLAMGATEDALGLAREMTERFPMLPRAWFSLSEVHSDRGEAEEEVAALEEALRINPNWDRALRKLSDGREKLGDYEGAVKPLRRAVEWDPLTAANHGCLADTLWKLGESEEAFQSIQTAAELDPDYGWAWDQLGDWARLLEREDEAIATGRKLCEERPASSDSWLRLRRIYASFPGRQDEQLEVLAEGLEHCPSSIDLHDIRSMVLAQMGRYREAIEASRPEVFEENRPHYLQGREAWVEWERGNRAEAIRILEKAMEGHSDWLWGYEMLTDWCTEEEEFDKAVSAVDHLVRLSPRSSTSHGFRGDLMFRKGEDKEAIASFERAFQLSPTYTFSAWHLVRLYLKSEEYENAEETLQVWRYHNPEDSGPAEMEVRLHAAKKDREKALVAFNELVRHRAASEQRLIDAEDVLREAGWQKEVFKRYRAAAQAEQLINTEAAIRWAAWGVYDSKKKLIKDLQGFRLDEPVLEAAWRSLIMELINDNRTDKALQTIRKHRDQYRSTTLLWATGCYACRMAKEFGQAVKWSEGWEERQGLESWMLINVALAHLVQSGLGASGPVHLFAIESLPVDHDTVMHHPFAALYEARDGSVEKAIAIREATELGVLNPFYQSIHQLSEYLIEHRETGIVNPAILDKAREIYPDLKGNPISRKTFALIVKETSPALRKAGWTGWKHWFYGFRCSVGL